MIGDRTLSVSGFTTILEPLKIWGQQPWFRADLTLLNQSYPVHNYGSDTSHAGPCCWTGDLDVHPVRVAGNYNPDGSTCVELLYNPSDPYGPGTPCYDDPTWTGPCMNCVYGAAYPVGASVCFTGNPSSGYQWYVVLKDTSPSGWYYYMATSDVIPASKFSCSTLPKMHTVTSVSGVVYGGDQRAAITDAPTFSF